MTATFSMADDKSALRKMSLVLQKISTCPSSCVPRHKTSSPGTLTPMLALYVDSPVSPRLLSLRMY